MIVHALISRLRVSPSVRTFGHVRMITRRALLDRTQARNQIGLINGYSNIYNFTEIYRS